MSERKEVSDGRKLKKLVDHYMYEAWTPEEKTTKELLEAFENYIKKIKESRNEDIDNREVAFQKLGFVKM